MLSNLPNPTARLKFFVHSKVCENNKLMEYDAILLDEFLDIF